MSNPDHTRRRLPQGASQSSRWMHWCALRGASLRLRKGRVPHLRLLPGRVVTCVHPLNPHPWEVILT